MLEWLNFHGPYGQYAKDLEDPKKQKMIKIIKRWGFYFDDEYYYWYVEKPTPKLKRFPIWAYPQRVVNAEKHKRPENQMKLKPFLKKKDLIVLTQPIGECKK